MSTVKKSIFVCFVIALLTPINVSAACYVCSGKFTWEDSNELEAYCKVDKTKNKENCDGYIEKKCTYEKTKDTSIKWVVGQDSKGTISITNSSSGKAAETKPYHVYNFTDCPEKIYYNDFSYCSTNGWTSFKPSGGRCQAKSYDLIKDESIKDDAPENVYQKLNCKYYDKKDTTKKIELNQETDGKITLNVDGVAQTHSFSRLTSCPDNLYFKNSNSYCSEVGWAIYKPSGGRCTYDTFYNDKDGSKDAVYTHKELTCDYDGDIQLTQNKSGDVTLKVSGKQEKHNISSFVSCPSELYYNDFSYCSTNGWTSYKSIVGRCTNAAYKTYKLKDNSSSSSSSSGGDMASCNVIPDIIKDWIKNILKVVRYIALALVIVLGALDFLKASGSGEPEQIKKSGQAFLKRMIAVAVLFLLPVLIDLILNLINMLGADPTCVDISSY